MSSIDATLGQLTAVSLLRRVLSEAEAEYKFRHTLDQQTAYLSLLRKDRERIHKVVGLVIERDPSTEPGVLAPILAQHFSVAGDDHRAMKYFGMAGDEAARVYAHTEALEYYERALGIAESIPGAEDEVRELYLRRGRTLELSGDYQGAMETYRGLEELGKSRREPRLELVGLTRQTTLLVAPSAVADPKMGEKLAIKLLELAIEVGDRESEARAHWSLLLAAVYSGRLKRAISEGEKALELARELGLEELEAYVLNDLSGPYMLSSHPKRAVATLNAAIEIWRRNDNLPMLVDSLANLNTSLIYSGEYDRALENSEQALEIADRIDNKWAKAFSLFLTELVHADLGHIAQAFQVCADQIRWGNEAGFKLPEVYSNAFQAWLYAYVGAFERAYDCLADASKPGKQLGEMWDMFPECMRLLVKLRQGDVAEVDKSFLERTADARAVQAMMSSPAGPYWALASAENDLLQGRFQDGIDRLMGTVERLQQAGFVVHLPDVLELLARIHRISGNSQAAYEAMAEAIAGAEIITCRRMLWVLHAERALWLEQDGRSEAAADERRLAKPIFDYVADHIGDDDLRRSFINAEWVRALKLG